MLITFDAAKNATNQTKHGVALAAAADLEWDTVLLYDDMRYRYGERRVVGIGYISMRLYCVVFTDRGDERRVISLRKANTREVASYARSETWNDLSDA